MSAEMVEEVVTSSSDQWVWFWPSQLPLALPWQWHMPWLTQNQAFNACRCSDSFTELTVATEIPGKSCSGHNENPCACQIGGLSTQ